MRFSKGLWVSAACAVLAGALGLGLWVGICVGRQEKAGVEGSTEWSRKLVPGSEYFIEGASFSEVETLKAELKAQAMHVLAELEAEYGPMHTGSVGSDVEGGAAQTDRLIESLREATEEFSGTSHQSVLLQHWLAVLRRAGRHNEWLDAYLSLVYRSPMDTLVGRLAPHAMRYARELGRVGEVVPALERVAELPVVFETKNLVEAVLGRGRSETVEIELPGGAAK